MTQTLSLGLDTFGDATVGLDGSPLPHEQVLRNVVEQGVLADAVGVDFLGVGEHHRDDFAVSSPEIVMAAIAARTCRIRLGTAVTVLSSDDPVRLFERFSTLNAVSNGRAEVILGRGSFTESFPLFGFDLQDYEVLFEEKLDLFSKLIREPEVTWSGKTRPPLSRQRVFPTLGEGLQVSIGVGGSPESVVRAVHYDLPMILAIIGGDPRRFLPYVDLYNRACAQIGRPVRPLGVHSPGHVAATDEEAQEQLWPHYRKMHDRIGGERGWPPTTKESFLNEVRHGSLYVGSPETVARKIAATVSALGLGRFNLKYSGGPTPHEHSMECIRLYGEKVIPMVRQILAGSPS
ncbi:LLM class flavin-dependent oxidoreductase [Tabrizicola sp. J26]|uniref:LLM class flavin-dependent oxidoreductase n=1 Tax=Alitabrizicola rongguiensis TaxID=2909234 RepID=UPI001F3A6979|nr:LLM class flavin-dependent oxidoreductase [Tabrizicola rongguiensis]MCF1707705.1 LLM class flavin-dependent oxidoreductase [Tabrizicola rongguiensis]